MHDKVHNSFKTNLVYLVGPKLVQWVSLPGRSIGRIGGSEGRTSVFDGRTAGSEGQTEGSEWRSADFSSTWRGPKLGKIGCEEEGEVTDISLGNGGFLVISRFGVRRILK